MLSPLRALSALAPCPARRLPRVLAEDRGQRTGRGKGVRSEGVV